MSRSNRVAVILAAGVGARLRPLTDDRPKCLVPIGRETILARAMALLDRAGFDRFVLSTGYREDAIRGAVAGYGDRVSFVSNPDFATTQNCVSLQRALHEVPPGRDVVKLDGDLIFTSAVVEAIAQASGAFRVAVDASVKLGAEEMKVETRDGRIVRFGKGIDPARAAGESIGFEWIGAEAVGRVRDALDAAIAKGRSNEYYEDVYNDVLDAIAASVVTVPSDAWMEVDDLDDLERARARFG